MDQHLLRGRSLTVPDGPQIVAAAPPGTNPYAYLHAFAAAVLTPQMPTSFFTGLIALAVLLVVGFGFAVAILVVPCLQGRDSVRRNLWLVRRKHVSQYRRPYIVPNFVLALSVSFIIHVMFSQVYVWTNYESYVNVNVSLDRQKETRLFLWYGIIWIPAYIGFWFSGFSGIYAAWLASSPGTTLTGMRHRYLRPEVLNALCWGVPVLVLLSTFALASTEAVKHEQLLTNSAPFLANLTSASALYDADGKLPTPITVVLFGQAAEFRDNAEAFFAAFAGCIGLWAFWLAVACLTHLGAMIALLGVVRQRMRTGRAGKGGGEGVGLTRFMKKKRRRSRQAEVDVEQSALGGTSPPLRPTTEEADGDEADQGEEEEGTPRLVQSPNPHAWVPRSQRRSAGLMPNSESWKRFSVLGPAGLGLDVRPPPASDDHDPDHDGEESGTARPAGETSEGVALKRTYWTVLIHFSTLVALSVIMLGTALWTISNLAEIEFRPSWRSATILLGIWPLAIAGTLGMALLLLRILATSRITLDGVRPVRPLSGTAAAPGHLSSHISEPESFAAVNPASGHEPYLDEEEEDDEDEGHSRPLVQPSPDRATAAGESTSLPAQPTPDLFAIDEGDQDAEGVTETELYAVEAAQPVRRREEEEKEQEKQRPSSRRVPVPVMSSTTDLGTADPSDRAPLGVDEANLGVAKVGETPELHSGQWGGRDRVTSGYGEITSEVDEFLDAVDFGWRDA